MTVKRYALIQNGIVENVILWDGDTTIWSVPEGFSAVDVDALQVGPNYTYDGAQFTAPPPLITASP